MSDWTEWLDEYKTFLSILSPTDSDIPSNQIEFSLEYGYNVTISSLNTSDNFQIKFLSFLYGAYILLRMNAIKMVKEGITSWNLNGVNISLDISNTRNIADDLLKEYQRLKQEFSAKNSSPGCSFTFTNMGTGLWQSTREYGPIFVRIGR